MNVTVNFVLSVVALLLTATVGIGSCVGLRRWVHWTDVILGAFTFAIAQVYVLGFLSSAVSAAVVGGGTLAVSFATTLLSAGVTALAFFFTLGFLYRGQATLKMALSAGLGALLVQLVCTAGYNALNYVLVYGALRSGDTSGVFGSFGAAQVAEMTAYFQGLSPIALLALALQPLVVLVSCAGATLLFFRAYDEFEPVGMLQALLWLVVCGVLGTTAQTTGPVVGLVGSLAVLALGYWFGVARHGSLVAPYLQRIASGDTTDRER